MAADESALEAAWAGWSDALVASLFPAGMAAGQNFAFGQTTLVADFANNDPLVVNAEVFRVADTVPGASAVFAPLASLSDAFGFFLKRLNLPALSQTQANWEAANSSAPSAYNMPTRSGDPAPAGSTATPATPAAIRYLPAYELDSGFRAKYQEWQASSIAGRTTAGGVIRFSIGAAAPLRANSVAAKPHASLKPFIRVLAPQPSHSASAPALANAPSVEGSCTIEVAFTGLGTFMLGPGRWFSDTAVRLFAGQLGAADQGSFFGNDGVLARRIYQVILGFEPSVNLHFDDAQAAGSAQAALAQGPGAAIGVGPLSFAAPASTAGSGGNGSTVSLGPTPSTLPILLGVVSIDLANLPPVS